MAGVRPASLGNKEGKPLDTQLCRKCNIEKPLDQFSKERRRKSGVRPYCKACELARVRAYQQEHHEELS